MKKTKSQLIIGEVGRINNMLEHTDFVVKIDTYNVEQENEEYKHKNMYFRLTNDVAGTNAIFDDIWKLRQIIQKYLHETR